MNLREVEKRLEPYNSVLLFVQDVLLVLVFLGFLLAAGKAVEVGMQIDAMGCSRVCQSLAEQCAADNIQVLNGS